MCIALCSISMAQVKVSVDERTNTLIVKAPPEIQKQIETRFTNFMLWVVGSFIFVIAGMYLFYIKFPHYFAA